MSYLVDECRWALTKRKEGPTPPPCPDKTRARLSFNPKAVAKMPILRPKMPPAKDDTDTRADYESKAVNRTAASLEERAERGNGKAASSSDGQSTGAAAVLTAAFLEERAGGTGEEAAPPPDGQFTGETPSASKAVAGTPRTCWQRRRRPGPTRTAPS